MKENTLEELERELECYIDPELYVDMFTELDIDHKCFFGPVADDEEIIYY